MGWVPQVELDGFTGFLVVLFILGMLWALIFTSGAIVTLGLWALILVVALLLLYYLVINLDRKLRGG